MRTLNLVDQNKSELKYSIHPFPDTQKNITIDKDYVLLYPKETPVLIKSRMSWDDVQLIICAVASLRRLRVKEIHLYIPYCLGARSDRRFEIGGNNYVGDVLSPIINSLGFETVTVMDAHSYCLDTGIKNLEIIDNSELVNFALHDIQKKIVPIPNLFNEMTDINGFIDRFKTNLVIMSPDAGASHKIYKLADKIGYTGDIVTCSKERDSDGKLTKTYVPDFDYKKDVVIIDDIFDFGGSFKNMAKAINEKITESQYPIGKKYLITTHSIQEEGLKEALKHFDFIYTTNSVKDFNIENVIQLNVF